MTNPAEFFWIVNRAGHHRRHIVGDGLRPRGPAQDGLVRTLCNQQWPAALQVGWDDVQDYETCLRCERVHANHVDRNLTLPYMTAVRDAAEVSIERGLEQAAAARVVTTTLEQHAYLTTEEVADLLRTSPETVRYWRYVDDGPPSFKVGRRVLYDRERLVAWIEAAHA